MSDYEDPVKGTGDHFRIAAAADPVTPIQRRLFNLLLWHALGAGETADGAHHVSLDSLFDDLGAGGRSREWLLLNLEKVAATRLRWHLASEGAAGEDGICPLLSECWVSGDLLTFRLPERLIRFAGERRLRRLLSLSVEELFQHPFTAGVYRMLSDVAESGTTGWMPIIRFCESAGIGADALAAGIDYLRDQVVNPATAEISLFSDLAVSAETRQGTEEGSGEIKFRIRRKDETRPDACLLLPGVGDGPITSTIAVEQQFEAYKAGLVCDEATAMSPAEMEDIRRSFVDSIRGNAVMMKKYEKDGFDSLAVKLAFEVYLERLLLSDEQRNREHYERKVKK